MFPSDRLCLFREVGGTEGETSGWKRERQRLREREDDDEAVLSIRLGLVTEYKPCSDVHFFFFSSGLQLPDARTEKSDIYIMRDSFLVRWVEPKDRGGRELKVFARERQLSWSYAGQREEWKKEGVDGWRVARLRGLQEINLNAKGSLSKQAGRRGSCDSRMGCKH